MSPETDTPAEPAKKATAKDLLTKAAAMLAQQRDRMPSKDDRKAVDALLAEIAAISALPKK